MKKTILIPLHFQHECNYHHEEYEDGLFFNADIKIIEDEGRCWATITRNKEVPCEFETEFEKP